MKILLTKKEFEVIKRECLKGVDIIACDFNHNHDNAREKCIKAFTDVCVDTKYAKLAVAENGLIELEINEELSKDYFEWLLSCTNVALPVYLKYKDSVASVIRSIKCLLCKTEFINSALAALKNFKTKGDEMFNKYL